MRQREEDRQQREEERQYCRDHDSMVNRMLLAILARNGPDPLPVNSLADRTNHGNNENKEEEK